MLLKKIFKKNDKAETHNHQPSRQKKIAVFVLKTLFIRIPLIIICLVLISGIIIKFYFNEERFGRLLTEQFAANSNGTMTVTVKKCDIYKGFILENIVIKNNKEFNESEFCRIDKVVVSYNVFSMLTGSVRFPEIGIYNPSIFLKQKNGKWNLETLMKPGPKPEPVVEEGPSSEEISLPISVDFYLKFLLKNLNIYIDGETFNAQVKGLSYTTEVDVPPFKKVKKNISALSLLKTLNMQLNPREELHVSFSSKQAKITPPVTLTWKMEKKYGDNKQPRYITSFKCGTNNSPVRLKNRITIPLHFFLTYDIHFIPNQDKVAINSLSLTFNKRKWFDIEGTIRQVTKKGYCNIRMKESSLYLRDLLPLYRYVTNDYGTRFSGTVSLYPFRVTGPLSAPTVAGELKMQKTSYSNRDATVFIPNGALNYTINYSGPKSDILAGLKVPYFTYSLKGKKSGYNAFMANLDINGYKNFKTISINDIGLKFYNPSTKGVAVTTSITGNLDTGKRTKGSIAVKTFRFDIKHLAGMVPENLQKTLKGIPLEKPVSMTTTAGFDMYNKTIALSNLTTIALPDYNIKDLKIKVNTKLENNNQKITIKTFNIGSRQYNLSFNVNGFVELKNNTLSDSDIKIALNFNNPKMKKIYGDWNAAGTIQLNTKIKGGIENGRTHGNVIVRNLSAINRKKFFDLKDMNLNFPFAYQFKTKKDYKSILDITKSDLIHNDTFSESVNMRLKELRIKHVSRQQSVSMIKDLTGSMVFRDNIFQITNLRAYVLGGSLSGRHIAFNLADLKTRHMEYKLIIDCTNIEVSRYDNPDPKQSHTEGQLSLNTNFTGKGINLKKNITANGYINIPKIGRQFADKLFRALNKKKGENMFGAAQLAVNMTATPKKFKFILDNDLAYATVDMFKDKVFYVKNDKLDYPRIAIKEYIAELLKE